MPRIDDLLVEALKTLEPKPSQDALQSKKKAYSEKVSQVVAQAFAEELRHRGMKEARPAPPGELDRSGAERRMAGGIGAKKVDVSWATDECGLLCAISVKSINFRDRQGHFQKNLTNRRGDMLYEAVTLHRRFPYAVLAGFLFLDKDAASDDTQRRRSTFLNAHSRLRMFADRNDPAGRDEQYERLYVILLDAGASTPTFVTYAVGRPETPVSLDEEFGNLVKIVAERNPDFYEVDDGRLRRLRA